MSSKGEFTTQVDETEGTGVHRDTTSVRQRVPTEKGREYTTELYMQAYRNAKRTWCMEADKTLAVLGNIVSLSELHSHKVKEGDSYKAFCEAYSKLMEANVQVDKEEIVKEYQEKVEYHEVVIEQVKRKEEQLLKGDDNVSEYSYRSNRSKATSALSTQSQRRLDAAAKVAKLRLEMEYQDQIQQTEAQLTKLKLMKEIKIASVELEAAEQALEVLPSDKNESEAKSLHLKNYIESQRQQPLLQAYSHEQHDQVVEPEMIFHEQTQHNKYLYNDNVKECYKVPATILNPTANSFTPKMHAQESNDYVVPNSNDFRRQCTISDLPRPEPEVFKGEVLEFSTWLHNFEIFIESRTPNCADRLFYLYKYTGGEVKEAIRNMNQLDNADAYKEAKDLLKRRYGDQLTIAEAHRQQLANWPKIPPHDGPALRKFSDVVRSCKVMMKINDCLKILNDPREIMKLCMKLPNALSERWYTYSHKYFTNSEKSSDNCQYITQYFPPFEKFSEFIQDESEKACNPILNACVYTSEQNIKPRSYNRVEKSRSCMTGATEDKSNYEVTGTKVKGYHSFNKQGAERGAEVKHAKKRLCPYCTEEHHLETCKTFNKLSEKARFEFIKYNRLCTGCLRGNHKKANCYARLTCQICYRYHPTVLHRENINMKALAPPPLKQSSSEAQKKNDSVPVVTHVSTVRVSHSVIGDKHTLILPVWLQQLGKDSKIMVYALLDTQADSCFIKESIVREMGFTGSEVSLMTSTVDSNTTTTCTKVCGLSVRGIYQENIIKLPPTYSKMSIPANEEHVPRPEVVEGWPHLHDIAKELMPYSSEVEIGLIIGYNCVDALRPVAIIPGESGMPFGYKTQLGWGIVGSTQTSSSTENDSAVVHRTIAQEVTINNEKKTNFLVIPTQTKELINSEQVIKMFEADFNENKVDGKPYSHDDKMFMKMMKESVHQLDNSHYELPLPLKNENIKFTNNKNLALHRLHKLKGKFNNDVKYYQDYREFMHSLIERGYAEEVPSKDLPRSDGHVWYIPHHGVYHPKKPGKIRVVYDCSAVYKTQSLNSELLQGPDLTNSLIGVLCRFRQESVAFVCDIEAMYHQVKVNPEHRDMLRFLWWKNGNVTDDICEYRMTAHLFGATSSPSIANFALKTAADDYESQCGSAAAEFIRRDFYVDDGLKSVPTAKVAIDLIQKSKSLCRKGGFTLHKFLSNNKEVLAAINNDEMNNSIKSLNICKDKLPIERTLGVEWCVESDTLQFRICLKDKPLTRRGILSTVSSVYDPLGLVSPLILIGKGMLQELCKDRLSWDDAVPETIRPKWERWRSELHILEQAQIQRCYKPVSFGDVRKVELHHFSDASQEGYGQCSYIRMLSTDNRVHCTLAMAKSRVTPLKAITVPRLELTAAVVSVRIHSLLKRELDYKEIDEYFWTDSKVVLGYINNDAKRFHVYVANRVQQIRDKTLPSQWNYVDSENNPADYASRGMTAKELITSSKWWYGPMFLWQQIEVGNSCAEYKLIPDEDPEVKRVVVGATQVQNTQDFLERLKYFSDWFSAKRATAVCLKLQQMYKKEKNYERKEKKEYTPVTTEQLRNAEKEILRQVQAHAFKEEIRVLKESVNEEYSHKVGKQRDRKRIKKASQLYKLDPFIDKDGLVRVGGRLRQASLGNESKHPVILPKQSHITDLIICHHHKKVYHQGRGITLNEIRTSGYWILGASSLVARHISKCVVCRRVRSDTQGQKMANLPRDRLEPSPPFTYAAVDFFGPFYIKEGRKELKRYGVIFTCLVSRAIHLETASSLDTDSFINAYRRFMCRRGPIRELRSDQGTNFVGAKNELINCLKRMDQSKVRTELLKDNCDWIDFKMNVPHASHMGGVWERQIRTVRNVLSVLLDQLGQQLDDEGLRTFMTEAEAIVNCRPLTVVDPNSNNLEPLTPSALLTLKSKVVLPPPGSFERNDVYVRKRWRRVQYLANEFWSKWKREYLQSLQTRSKWQRPKRNISVDDIVIVKDHSLARNKWKLGRVVEAFPADDGLVRKVKVVLSDADLDDNGKRTVKYLTTVERPVHSLVLLLEGNHE